MFLLTEHRYLVILPFTVIFALLTLTHPSYKIIRKGKKITQGTDVGVNDERGYERWGRRMWKEEKKKSYIIVMVLKQSQSVYFMFMFI